MMRGEIFYACDHDGLLVPARELKIFMADAELVKEFEAKTTAPDADFVRPVSTRECPSCTVEMKTFKAQTLQSLLIDVCQDCMLFWFDQGEWEIMQKAHATTRRAIGDAMQWPSKSLNLPQDGLPIMGYLGFPVAETKHVAKTLPVMTIMISLFSFILTAMALKHANFETQFEFDPQHPFGHWGFSLITSLLVHGSYGHLIGNLGFFWLVGNDLEDEIGARNFLFSFILCGVAGHALYTHLGFIMPTVGMSGAVFGLLIFYATAFPKNRIQPYWQWTNFSIPAPTFALLYASKELYFAYGQVHGSDSHVNHLAHVGGALAGAICYFLFAPKKVTSENVAKKLVG